MAARDCGRPPFVDIGRAIFDVRPPRASAISSVQSLQRERNCLPTTDAERNNAVLDAITLHRVQKPRGQHRTARTDRVSMRDGAAFDVHDIFRDAKVLGDGKGDGRGSLVDLDPADVRNLPAGSLQRLLDGWYWT